MHHSASARVYRASDPHFRLLLYQALVDDVYWGGEYEIAFFILHLPVQYLVVLVNQ
jgi:hypothetical protein